MSSAGGQGQGRYKSTWSLRGWVLRLCGVVQSGHGLGGWEEGARQTQPPVPTSAKANHGQAPGGGEAETQGRARFPRGRVRTTVGQDVSSQGGSDREADEGGNKVNGRAPPCPVLLTCLTTPNVDAPLGRRRETGRQSCDLHRILKSLMNLPEND